MCVNLQLKKKFLWVLPKIKIYWINEGMCWTVFHNVTLCLALIDRWPGRSITWTDTIALRVSSKHRSSSFLQTKAPWNHWETKVDFVRCIDIDIYRGSRADDAVRCIRSWNMAPGLYLKLTSVMEILTSLYCIKIIKCTIAKFGSF